MAQNEETLYLASTSKSQKETSSEKRNDKASKTSWKGAAVGGLAGGLAGAGAMYAGEAMAHGKEIDNPDVATDGDNPAKDEAAINDGAKAAGVASEGRSSHDTEDVDVVSHPSSHDVDATTDEASVYQANDVHVTNGQDSDVHLVNAGEVQLTDGSMATVGVFDVNGQQVGIVDFDQDGTPDVAICDANGNGHIDVGEAIDLHTGQVINVDANDYANGDTDMTNDPSMQTASLENPDMATDMPDYDMPDADIQMA